MSDIGLTGITKTYTRGAAPAVRDVSLTVADGEFFVLLGPSGCGKTTLLRAIAGLEHPDAGTIRLGDRDVTGSAPRQRDLAMVFQGYAVFPHLTVYDNIGFGLSMRHEPRAEIDARVREAAGLVQLDDVLERYPSALSGGQRQRVAVARAVAVRPSVLLMDEPLSNLDALLRLTFRSDLKRLAKELNTTIVYVTHDQVEALSLGDRIAVMRDGEIVQCGTPMEVYDRPATRFVGGFIGTPPMNFLPVTISRDAGRAVGHLGEHAIRVPDWVSGDTVLAGIRAENLAASTTEVPDAMLARVRVVEPLGSQLLVTVAVGSEIVKLLTPNDFPAADDQRLWMTVADDKVRWFSAHDERELTEERATSAV
ncbi:MAG TPA: ABC transporter ATP-binding protein [Pseudonocardia sp.]|nr:ABC transporter ATP-binding protein [Pseudonocardia sp.]